MSVRRKARQLKQWEPLLLIHVSLLRGSAVFSNTFLHAYRQCCWKQRYLDRRKHALAPVLRGKPFMAIFHWAVELFDWVGMDCWLTKRG